jgi:hypothetical protein
MMRARAGVLGIVLLGALAQLDCSKGGSAADGGTAGTTGGAGAQGSAGTQGTAGTQGAAGTQGSAGAGGQGGGTCAFVAAYAFGDDGGFRAFSEESTLSAPRTHAIERMNFGAASDGKLTCAREVPCASATAVTVPAIEAAVANADVQAALAKAPGMVYGTDSRPVDGTVFKFARGDRTFFVGGGNAVPAGLRALEALLRKLTEETKSTAGCASLKN